MVLAPHNAGIMLLSRIFTVLAAAQLVGAFGLLMLAPDGMGLEQGITALRPHAVTHLRQAVQHLLGGFSWSHAFAPLLARPVWFIPLVLGLVCAAAARSTVVADESPHSRHTRG